MSEKIHPPTPRRRKQAKEQGRAPRSGDVVSAGLLLATTGMLSWFGPDLAEGMMGTMSDAFNSPPPLSLDRADSMRMILRLFATIGYLISPLLIAMMLCGVGLNVLQTGWMLTPAKLAPSLDHVSPTRRIQSITSARALGRFLITLLKLIAVIAVAISIARTSLPTLMTVSELPIKGIATTIFGMLIECCFWMGLTLTAFACVDYSLARWQHERDLMMTEQELREEMRDAQRASVPAPARSQAVQGVG